MQQDQCDDSFDSELQRRLAEVEVTSELAHSVDSCVEELQRLLHAVCPRWKIRLFGSFVTGFSTHDSDLDATCCRDGHSETSSKAKHFLGRYFLPAFQTHSNFEVVKKEFEARVPTLKLRFNKVLDVDFSFQNLAPMRNTQLLRAYAELHPLVRKLVMGVKVWAKEARVYEAKQCHLSSYSLSLMTIYFLQVSDDISLPCLPTSAFTGRGDTMPAEAKLEISIERPLSVLLTRFFRFYAFEFWWGEEVVSVHVGKRTRRCDPLHIGLRDCRIPRLHIADPFLTEKNLGCMVDYIQERTLYGEMFKAAAAMCARTHPVGLSPSQRPLNTPAAQSQVEQLPIVSGTIRKETVASLASPSFVPGTSSASGPPLDRGRSRSRSRREHRKQPMADSAKEASRGRCHGHLVNGTGDRSSTTMIGTPHVPPANCDLPPKDGLGAPPVQIRGSDSKAHEGASVEVSTTCSEASGELLGAPSTKVPSAETVPVPTLEAAVMTESGDASADDGAMTSSITLHAQPLGILPSLQPTPDGIPLLLPPSSSSPPAAPMPSTKRVVASSAIRDQFEVKLDMETVSDGPRGVLSLLELSAAANGNVRRRRSRTEPPTSFVAENEGYARRVDVSSADAIGTCRNSSRDGLRSRVHNQALDESSHSEYQSVTPSVPEPLAMVDFGGEGVDVSVGRRGSLSLSLQGRDDAREAIMSSDSVQNDRDVKSQDVLQAQHFTNRALETPTEISSDQVVATQAPAKATVETGVPLLPASPPHSSASSLPQSKKMRRKRMPVLRPPQSHLSPSPQLAVTTAAPNAQAIESNARCELLVSHINGSFGSVDTANTRQPLDHPCKAHVAMGEASTALGIGTFDSDNQHGRGPPSEGVSNESCHVLAPFASDSVSFVPMQTRAAGATVSSSLLSSSSQLSTALPAPHPLLLRRSTSTLSNSHPSLAESVHIAKDRVVAKRHPSVLPSVASLGVKSKTFHDSGHSKHARRNSASSLGRTLQPEVNRADSKRCRDRTRSRERRRRSSSGVGKSQQSRMHVARVADARIGTSLDVGETAEDSRTIAGAVVITAGSTKRRSGLAAGRAWGTTNGSGSAGCCDSSGDQSQAWHSAGEQQRQLLSQPLVSGQAHEDMVSHFVGLARRYAVSTLSKWLTGASIGA
eukprot:TRINITY_DN55925_c0_g1_i1.p1 TRINITY_DN55925_c0_g1~~TRINITY_DN55925_c0_g1_i1.p1  ORF type:complete len:1150 (+),score=155.41 TRINITY_DN55925_c0_g1_i1:42-3491(+)